MLASLLLSAAILGQCAGGSCSVSSGYYQATPAYRVAQPVYSPTYTYPSTYLQAYQPPTSSYYQPVIDTRPRGWLVLRFDLSTYRQRRAR